MKCSDIAEFAPLYLTGELDPARTQVFSAHLGDCPACRQELREQTAFDERLRASLLAERVDSSRIDRQVRDAIHTRWRTWVFTAAAIAAVLLLTILGYRILFATRTPPVFAAAARDHRVEIVDRQPRKWFTDRASIDGLARREGLPGSAVSSFIPAGYRLAQGKLCMLNGRGFLHLVYVSDAGNFSLFLRRPDDAAPPGLHADSFAAEHVAGFQSSQLSALFVTDQSGDAALHLAESAAHAAPFL
jgi:anti-sigma factor RsiW